MSVSGQVVYVLLRQVEWEGYSIEGVFSNHPKAAKAKAKAELRENISDRFTSNIFFDIEQYILDKE